MSSTPKTRVGIYARVSTTDKGQDPENQLRELRAFCDRMSYDVTHEYVDRESGRKGVADREQFNQLFKDAARRKFDLVLFWSLDRFSREGLSQTVMHLQRLTKHGVGFRSYMEEHLSTGDEVSQDILLGVFAALAKMESRKISERTKAGMARARANGKRIGRPSIPPEKRSRIEALHGQYRRGKRSINSISQEVGVAFSTAHKIIRELDKQLT